MADFFIRNAALAVTMDDEDRVISGGDMLIEDGKISQIGQGLTTPRDFAGEIIEGARFLVTPGLVNTHHHLYQTLTRAVPEAQNASLFGWL
ncbi:MAG: 8-oxoguanine deaminase, partial [Pseudomonadota bacterium]